MKHGSLFSGIGCWGFAADKLGWETVFNCEINDFCQTVLKYYWPHAETFTDISKSDFSKYANGIDVLSGSCPCQPFSVAGKRKGSSDDRHLWPFMLAAIRVIKPVWVCYENVPGITHVENGMVFEQVSSDLEDEGYETAPPLIIPACAKDAVHRRDRIWITGYHAANAKRSAERQAGNSASISEREQTIIHKEGQSGQCEALQHNGCDSLQPGTTPHSRLQRQAQHDEQAAGIEQCIADVTNSASEGLEGGIRGTSKRERFASDDSNAANTGSERQQGPGQHRGRVHKEAGEIGQINRVINGSEQQESWLEAATRLCSVDDEYAGRLDIETFFEKIGIEKPKRKKVKTYWREESLKAYGNAIYWPIAYEIFKAIDLLSKEQDVQEGDTTGDAT